MRWIALVLLAGVAGSAWADDPAKKACFADAKRLCPAEVKSLSRHKVELCLNRQVEKTTPGCHAMILKVRADRLGVKPAG